MKPILFILLICITFAGCSDGAGNIVINPVSKADMMIVIEHTYLRGRLNEAQGYNKDTWFKDSVEIERLLDRLHFK